MQAIAIPGYRGHIAGKDSPTQWSRNALPPCPMPDSRLLPRKVSENLHGGTFGSENHLATQSLPLRPGLCFQPCSMSPRIVSRCQVYAQDMVGAVPSGEPRSRAAPTAPSSLQPGSPKRILRTGPRRWGLARAWRRVLVSGRSKLGCLALASASLHGRGF